MRKVLRHDNLHNHHNRQNNNVQNDKYSHLPVAMSPTTWRYLAILFMAVSFLIAVRVPLSSPYLAAFRCKMLRTV